MSFHTSFSFQLAINSPLAVRTEFLGSLARTIDLPRANVHVLVRRYKKLGRWHRQDEAPVGVVELHGPAGRRLIEEINEVCESHGEVVLFPEKKIHYYNILLASTFKTKTPPNRGLYTVVSDSCAAAWPGRHESAHYTGPTGRYASRVAGSHQRA